MSTLLPAAAAAGASGPLPSDFGKAVTRAIAGVWGSRWGAGAAAALAAARMGWGALRVGVLVQPVAPLRYAFVAHTRK